MSSGESGQEEAQELFGYVAAGLSVAILVVYVVPAVGIGIALGCLGGAAATWTSSKSDSGSGQSFTGAQMILAGVSLIVAYSFARSGLGAGGENRHLSRQWGMGRTDLSAFLHRPWAWVPVACAVALIVSGAIVWRRSR